MRFAQLLLVVSAATGFQAAAQTTGWDTSGNGMLNGTYYFRQVIYQLASSANGSLADAVSLYGSASFSGTGTYSMTVTLVDLAAGQLQHGTLTGTYSIAASGQGFLSSPLFSGDYIFGLVNQQGIFVGSSTETLNGYNDLFIAAPLANPVPTASTFKGSYSMAYMDLSSGSPLSTIGLQAQMTPDGNGAMGYGAGNRVYRRERVRQGHTVAIRCEIHLQQRGGRGDLSHFQHRLADGAILPLFFARWQLCLWRVAGLGRHVRGSTHGHVHAQLERPVL